MSALLDSFRDALAQSPARGTDADARHTLLEAALRDGLPGPRDEAWKYTPLRALERRGFAPAPAAAPAIDPALLTGIPAPRLVFVNGRHAASLSDLSGLPAGVELRPLSTLLAEDGHEAARFLGRRYERRDEAFARINAALADEGTVLRVEQGLAVATALHLVFVGAEDGSDRAWHLRNLIELRHGASLSIVEHHLDAGAPAHLDNALTHIHLAAQARLQHVRLQTRSPRMTGLLRTDAVLAREAEYRRVDLELGAALSRHELNVRLEGDGARLHANGVQLGDGRRHLDTRLGIEHIARDTACELVWRGMADARSKVVFHGGIHIRPGADGSDASLSSKNLLLSADAEIDTQPVLVIDTDEVKAAHGATVGQLDQTALFYLRSRGIPEPQARRMLTAAFCHEPLRGIGDVALQAVLTRALDATMALDGDAQ